MKVYVKPTLSSDEINALYDLLYDMIAELYRLGAGTEWAKEKVKQLQNICFTKN